jgi:hypothetical protein|tara:strand:+ start:46 stop:237 length:192 start_codon:yes stop_codon:yes gene_type:complete
MTAIYTGTLVEKHAGNLDKSEIGAVLAISTAHNGGKIYRVIVDGEIKNWYGEFVRKVEDKSVA